MSTNTILIALVALLVGGIGGYNLPTDYDRYHHRGMMMGDVDRGKYEDDSKNVSPMGNMGGMHMMDMMVSSEKEFLRGMIPHHQEAVDTAKEVLERGATTPEIRQLMEDIVVAQEKEIADMKAWYSDWYGEEYVEQPNDYSPMMRELENLSGAEIDRVFLEDMIMHHMGAIMMARSVQPYVEHDEIAELTQAIVSSQSAEIAQMRQMLRSL